MKKSRKNASLSYFHGELSDGKKLVRMVSFDPSLQSEMKKAQESESVVAVANCQVKQSTRLEKASPSRLTMSRSSSTDSWASRGC